MWDFQQKRLKKYTGRFSLSKPPVTVLISISRFDCINAALLR